MATWRTDGEPSWPADLQAFDPTLFDTEFDWEVARVRYARSLGFKQYKVLPLLQAMVQSPLDGEVDA